MVENVKKNPQNQTNQKNNQATKKNPTQTRAFRSWP